MQAGFRRKVNQDVYHNKEWQWQEGDYTVTRTCQWSPPGCHQGCSVLFYVKDGKIEKVEGDPNSPVNHGRLCVRCLDMLEAVYNEDRVIYPMKRAGDYGENKWERISWDEAIDWIASEVKRITETYGAHSIFCGQGTGRNATWTNASLGEIGFNTPNVGISLSGETCYAPRMTAMNLFLGAAFIADMGQQFEDRYDNPAYHYPALIGIWGCQPFASNSDGFYGHWIMDCMRAGSKIFCVDPRVTWLAAKAEVFLQLRPGTDGAVALGILNEIVKQDLVDHEFVDEWCHGYDQMVEACAPYTPEKVEEITWVPAEKIVAAATLIGTSHPFAMQWGLAVDMQTYGCAAAFAIQCILAVTGNFDRPGSNIVFNNGYVQADIRESLLKNMDKSILKDQLGNNDPRYPLRTSFISPMVLPDCVMEAMETDQPFPIKMVWLESSNPLSCTGQDPYRWLAGYRRSIEFCVVADPFMTPSAVALADLVLPVAFSCERDSMRAWWTPFRAITKVVEPLGEAMDDETLMWTIGRACHPENFPWETADEMRDYFMKNLDSTDYTGSFEDLKKEVWHFLPFEYEKFKTGGLRADGKPGFATLSGKLELYSEFLAAYGLNPSPYYEEPLESPVSQPEMAKEYPFVLTTGQRSWFFFHSENRQMQMMREFHPWPLAYMNEEDAAELGLHEGDWIYIENVHGKIKQKLKVGPAMLKGVVNCEHGWWFPELDGNNEDGWFKTFECNPNCLIPQGQQGPEGFSAPVKSGLCKVYKCEDSNPEIEWAAKKAAKEA